MACHIGLRPKILGLNKGIGFSAKISMLISANKRISAVHYNPLQSNGCRSVSLSQPLISSSSLSSSQYLVSEHLFRKQKHKRTKTKTRENWATVQSHSKTKTRGNWAIWDPPSPASRWHLQSTVICTLRSNVISCDPLPSIDPAKVLRRRRRRDDSANQYHYSTKTVFPL